MRIKDLPVSEKPRERLIKYGASNLSNEDLISIILRTGTKSENVKVISNKILSKIKTINDLSHLSIKELTSINGVGSIKAVTLLAALELVKSIKQEFDNKTIINNTKTVHKYFAHLIGDKKQEEMLIILDMKGVSCINNV